MNLKEVLVLYFLSCANFWPNKEVFAQLEETNSLCNDFEKQLDAAAKRVSELKTYMKSTVSEIHKLKMLREKAYFLRPKAPLKILEVKGANGRLPSNCNEIDKIRQNLLYRVAIAGSSFPVSCDFKTEDSAWTVIQRRQDGSVIFFRNWTVYVHGFGDLDGEFFIGLEKLHVLTTKEAAQELYIILEDFEGVRKYAKYNTFRVESAAEDYKLIVDGYSGDAGDCLQYHNNTKFHTWDHDTPNQCAWWFQGAWWYNACFSSNLNGKYLIGKKLNDKKELIDYTMRKNDLGAAWNCFHSKNYSLKFIQMMIRPRKN